MITPDSVTVPTLPAHTTSIDLAETLVALANGRGGTVHLQFGEAGLTLEDAIDRVREASLRADPILVLPSPQVANVRTLAITVPRGLPRVFSVEGRYVIRQDGVNKPLGPRNLRQLLLERGDISYEEETPPGATMDDLDWLQVEAYAASLNQGRHRETPQEVLIRRGCAVNRDGTLKPTNAGILLFGKYPQRFIRGAAITAARFAGATMGDVFTKQDISGTLPDQIRRAETFLWDNLRKGVQLGTHMARAEQLEYPMAAVRELVVNAVSHRDYSIHGDDIRLFIFADRLEVTSPGNLPGPVTIDNIAEERFSRNPALVQVLSDMGYIERLGYGVDRVIALMSEYGLPAPYFEETSGGFRAQLQNYNATPKTPEPMLPNGMLLTPRQESALYHLNQGHSRITNKDLQELFPEIHPETIRRDLADLVSKGLLVKLGQKRGSYYILADHVSGEGKR